MCASIVDGSTYQYGFANHGVDRSVNKIQILSFSPFHKKTNLMLSTKNCSFACIHIPVACFVGLPVREHHSECVGIV